MAQRKREKAGSKPPNDSNGGAPSSPIGARELIVIAQAGSQLRATPAGVASAAGVDVSDLAAVLAGEGAELKPLFGMSEVRMANRVASMVADESTSAMATYYYVDAPDERLDDLAASLAELDSVAAAYVKPPAELAVAGAVEAVELLNRMTPRGEESPPATPSFEAHQIYLDAAPAGIDARHAWTLPGGRGGNVKVIDCEWGWQFTHEDLLQNSMGVVVGSSLSYDSNPAANTGNNRTMNHGTAVVGEIGGDRNSLGITGIAPDASVGAASFVTKPSSTVIREAADRLSAGDIILLEIHRAGPRFNFQGRDDQNGYIAIEWWPDDFAAIRYAVTKGIIVVEAAGNGQQNLDDAIYSTRPSSFPTSWRNPFSPANPSSQAVVVGAGAPPPGTHGRNHGPDRSRLGFSNYGQRIDCQGWGREVTSTAYGDLQGGSNPNEWYTDTFSGTSSASPIVVGALACVQGILRAQGASVLTPAQAITALRNTGSPQQDAPGRPSTQRIGTRPDLRQLIPAVVNGWSNNRTVVRTHAKNGAQQTWAILNGTGWLRVTPNAPDGVTNNFVLLCEALANGRNVDVLLQGGQITQVTLR